MHAKVLSHGKSYPNTKLTLSFQQHILFSYYYLSTHTYLTSTLHITPAEGTDNLGWSPRSLYTKKKNFYFFNFADTLIQSLRNSSGCSLTETSNKNQPEYYTMLLLRSHKGKGPWFHGSACHTSASLVLQKIQFPRGK